jgi:hypothetical protein
MKLLALVTSLMALGISTLGVLGMTAPALLLEMARLLTTGSGLYGAAVLRVVFGALLLLLASGSRMPAIIRVIGFVIVVAGLLTPFFGVAAGVFTWISAQDPRLIRAVALLPFAFGLFIVYAINSPRDSVAGSRKTR